MPELPEVETFLTYLKNNVKNEKITSFDIFYPKLITKKHSIATFKEKLLNNYIDDLKRRGKYLLFFIGQNVLITHLRMEGNFYVTSPKEICSKHCLIQFNFQNKDKCLRFVDSRRFGTFDLTSKTNYLEHKSLKKLGLEPFDQNLNISYLKEKWKKRKINIKKGLLDQTVISGIGNIYACEILFISNISPFTPVNVLNDHQIQNIISNSQKILKEAISMKGSTTSTFHVGRHQGLFHTKFKVYGRKGKKCFKCQKIIVWKKIGNRGTFFCSNCQY